MVNEHVNKLASVLLGRSGHFDANNANRALPRDYVTTQHGFEVCNCFRVVERLIDVNASQQLLHVSLHVVADNAAATAVRRQVDLVHVTMIKPAIDANVDVVLNRTRIESISSTSVRFDARDHRDVGKIPLQAAHWRQHRVRQLLILRGKVLGASPQ